MGDGRGAGLLDGAVGDAAPSWELSGPGIGKSRLTREIAAMAAGCGAEVVVGYCESHTSKVPFHLAAQFLRAAFAVADLDAPAARAKVREQVTGASAEDLLLLDDVIGVADRPHRFRRSRRTPGGAG